MSRTRIVKGNITKIIGGNYKRYSKDDIVNIGSKVIQVGKEGGVLLMETILTHLKRYQVTTSLMVIGVRILKAIIKLQMQKLVIKFIFI